ncbi:3-isopropylmalate dehydrogenase [Sphingomonas ginkgonis]|uniref:3-isopropylmalate dehydrogenase n=1 Tax=Sphingomonas ginkgonis TaxID=2315330 RepID=A0A3S0EK20_9SPHN|nr:3-isopropylmalate dehydrogenase [Sphingomonas ginkgonis]RST29481.1 3-isopropylmalate dehydrogenase [Sphingomonas ginkgonis]
MINIVILPGDGIGPEVTTEAVRCLELLSRARGLGLRFTGHHFGGAGIDAHGDPLPASTLAACKAANAVLLGAVGGDKWDEAPIRPEAGLLRIRAELGLYANLRPARIYKGLEDASPLRADLAQGTDVLVVRELTGGLYFGARTYSDEAASDLCSYSRPEIERIAHIAFHAARGRRRKLCSVDKANVLATSKLWRKVVSEIAAGYPEVELSHLYVDAAAMALVTRPRDFDVILTENLFGDILSDELSVIGGSIGLLGSASVGGDGPGLFEPIHGSAPPLAGKDVANPAGAIASAAMMLTELGLPECAQLLTVSLERTIEEGHRTADLGGTTRCSEFGARVRDNLRFELARSEAGERRVA